ncbi:MAG: type II toxin-antitoxin system VapB family antitoxin [Actinomycetota bacterium]
MVRTNVVIDEELVQKAIAMYSLRSKRDAVDLALRRLVGEMDPWKGMLALEGKGWGWDEDEQELDRMRERPSEGS